MASKYTTLASLVQDPANSTLSACPGQWDGVSYKVLTETLHPAERDGFIARHLDGERIETATLYELTDLGRSLDTPLAAVAEWTNENWHVVDVVRKRWDRLHSSEADSRPSIPNRLTAPRP